MPAIAAIALLVLLVLVFPARAQSIVALDLGVDFLKVVLVQPGKLFDVALSPDSKRKTYSGLAIVDGVRSYGSDSFNVYGKRPANAIWQARDLLGKSMDQISAERLRKHLIHHHGLTVADDGSNAVRIEFGKGTKDERVFAPEEVVAMILGFVRDMGERHGGTKVTSCVITVPAFFTQAQRQSMHDAAEIAGLQLLSLVDENTAAAVQFAVDRTFTEEPKNILFFNMGSGSTQVSVVSFTGRQDKLKKEERFVRVLSKTWDETLGASEFDIALMDFFASDFDKLHPSKEGSIRESARAMVRLKKEGRSVKEILSGLDKFPVSFQSLHRDVDYKQTVTRGQLEELAAPLLKRIADPIERALADAGVPLSNLSGIEIIGGGVRIPSVRAEMRKVLPGDLEFSTHINGDEGMALGAAFVGANVSKTFRVPRVVVLQDALATDVRLVLKGSKGAETLTRDSLVFAKGTLSDCKEPVTHNVKFTWAGDFTASLVSSKDGALATYAVQALEDADALVKKEAYGEPKVFLALQLDRNLMVSLAAAEVRVEEVYAVAVPVKPAANGSNATASSNETETVTRTRVHRFPLKTVRTDEGVAVKRMSAEAKKQAVARLRAWDVQDKMRAKREEARNALESYSFVAKDKLESRGEQLLVVSTAEHLDELKKDLGAVEDWIFEHKDSTVEEFDAQRLALEQRVEYLFRLVRETIERPGAVAAFVSALDAVDARRGNWTVERPWIKSELFGPVTAAVASARKRLATLQEQQDKLTPKDEPVLTVAVLEAELEKVQRQVEIILRMRKPVKEPELKPKGTKAPVKSADDGDAASSKDDAQATENDAQAKEGGEDAPEDAESKEEL